MIEPIKPYLLLISKNPDSIEIGAIISKSSFETPNNNYDKVVHENTITLSNGIHKEIEEIFAPYVYSDNGAALAKIRRLLQ